MTDTDTTTSTEALERRIDALSAQIAVLVAEVESQGRRRKTVEELGTDVMPIVQRGVEIAIERAADLEARGYLEFATSAAGVVDRVVATYGKEDIEALSDNIIQMLDIVKDLTQPDMLAMAQRLLDVVRQDQAIPPTMATQPPSLMALVGKLRDPDVRRGMGRALDTFKAVNQPTEPQNNVRSPSLPHDTAGGA